MMLAMMIYLIDVITSAKDNMFGIVSCALVSAGMWALYFLWLIIKNDVDIDWEDSKELRDEKRSTNYERAKQFRKVLRVISVALLVLGTLGSLFSTFTPTKQTAYTMLAAYGVEQAAKLPQVQAVADKSLRLLNQEMDKYSKEAETPTADTPVKQ